MKRELLEKISKAVVLIMMTLSLLGVCKLIISTKEFLPLMYLLMAAGGLVLFIIIFYK